jgi:pyruvate-formate lyase-activating enzyme
MFNSIEPAIDPNNKPTFLLDWELTLRCNLDCSYCATEGPLRGHDNTTEHPPLDECLETIDFMYEYVDAYMEHKPRWTRRVVLNVYGGESLFHPDIVEILEQVRERHAKYSERWPLTVTCTTNGVVGRNLMNRVTDLVDEFTVSYHVETLPKQKQQVLDNLSLLKEKNKRVKCIVLMHGNEEYWPELLEVIEFCKTNDVKYLPRHLDGDINSSYNQRQVTWFKQLWQNKIPEKSQSKQQEMVDMRKNDLAGSDENLGEVGRACCGGRLVCSNEDLDKPFFYVTNNNFKGWSCSVNWFFLFIRQATKEIFTNKDCRMRFDGTVGPIGYIGSTDKLLEETKKNLSSNSMPIITCAKQLCMCGLCAPKAKDTAQLINIMKKHVTTNVFESTNLAS